MASERSPFNPRRQEIPLQDLSPPLDQSPEIHSGRRHRSTRSRNILGNRRSFTGRVNTAYERVDEGSPPAREGHHGLPHVTTPRNAHQPYPYDDGEVSPVDAGGFATAIGSMGLSFEPSLEPPYEPAGPSRPTLGRRRSTLNAINETDDLPMSSMTPTPAMNEPDPDNYFSPQDNDQTPLTDSRYLAPISGGPRSAPHSSTHSRMGSRLGDDLNMEAGRAARPSSTLSTRSLAPPLAGSTLSRAGTMIRKASQRIVNLSNEPDALDSHIRRQRSASDREGRMEAPPALPAMQDYAHDDRSSLSLPVEKIRPVVTSTEESESHWAHPNPLRGKSLGLFGPENWLRLLLCEVLVHPVTEPIILILIVIQTVVLAVDSAQAVQYLQKPMDWKVSWANFVLLGLFSIYTLEIIVRVIVSGFIKNAEEYSTNDLDLPFLVAISNRVQSFFTPQRRPSTNPTGAAAPEPSILRSFTNAQVHVDQPGHSRQAQRLRLARRAFLRHGFNRLDFVAVISFWISFFLSVFWIAPYHHIYVFKMLSCLRILRLLGLTSGTSVILRSLKKAAPLLVNVAFLIGFFWLLFAIIGVQSFKASFRRTCMWTDFPGDIIVNNTSISEIAAFENFTWNAGVNIQLCGGHINKTDKRAWPWLKTDDMGILQSGTSSHKGYLCPENSLCLEGTGPYNNTVSFDNIGNSLELVFVVISANTFSDLLYDTTESDFLAGALFFAFGIMIMSLWLTNLLVAVITSSFQVIREESKTSAFTADDEKYEFLEDEEPPVKTSLLKRAHDKTYWLWIAIILFDLIIMCLRSSTMGLDRATFIDWTEKVVTFVLDIEIVLRFLSDWRNFHKGRHNWVDLALAVITSIIQLPSIHESGTPYAWLSFFQIVRFYRVVLGVSITRELILKVLGNASGLLNLIIFVFLLTFLTAIFAVQIFQGEFPPYDVNGNNVRINFSDIYNSFIGMYQVLSSENWTILMYNSTQYQQIWSSSWIGATFFILWFILANFIVLNMFIAFITENFDVSEDEKRLHQVKAFLQQKELGGSSHGNLSLATIFKLGRDKVRHRDPLDYGPATMEMLLQEAVFRDFLDEQMEPMDELHNDDGTVIPRPSGPAQPGILSGIWSRILKITGFYEPNPFYSGLQFSKVNEELDIRTQARQFVSAAEQRKKAQRQYLLQHPSYNVSLFIFTPSNPVRRFCQRIVGPGRGSQRVEGVDPIKPVWYAFSAFIYAAIVAMVIIACVTTPLYQREYFNAHGGYNSRNWFTWTDMGFAVLFTLEALIKIIADGFFWTPNAFFRGSWGFVDGVVLVTLWINVITSLYKDGAVSRAVGAFKALRALRLLNVSDSARDTFHSVIVLGGWKVISSAFVSLSLLFPFAIYGLNLFNGQMRQCNDNGFPGGADLSLCVGEYSNEYLFNPNWSILQPRAAVNPYYNFDDFGYSLSILFQIVSQEGWTDVMWTAMEASGVNLNTNAYNSQGNAVFFIIFNLLGTVFVLTLFVSVFMRNYTEQTGVAFLTADQRSWLELRKILRQINPSKRPSNKSENGWRAWCYRIAVKKHGRWQRCLTFVLCFHLVLLCLEFYPEPPWWQTTRDMLFLAFTLFYIANVIVRIIGLTWKRFRKSSWDLYSIFSVTGTVITTLLDLSQVNNIYTPKSNIELYGQLHKLFLVSITLLLIPRNNQLDQLFKTAAASLSAIGNLLATWFVLFLVFAIALTQTFGLTRFGSQENGNLNFRNIPKALILLFRMSCGEGWNAIMEDFATIIPPTCVEDALFYESDCGSAAWARSLFITWNILSMYIFVSLFVSLIFESFSYVYQRSSGLAVVSREEIRRFKQAWATFDPEGTGFIPADVFPRLLGELSGVFEMRIYAGGDHSVGRILDNCLVKARGNETPTPGTVHGVDLAELNRQLRMIDVHDIRRRRQRMEVFYQEIMVSAHPDRGINFTTCLMILAHYNVISDSKSLRLEEYLRRRARLQRVEEEVNRRIVKGFFDMMYWTRKFQDRLNFRHSARMVQVPQFAVPEIFVDDQDASNDSGQVGNPPQDPFTDEPINITPTHHRQGSSPQRPGRPSLDTSGIRHRGDPNSRSQSISGDRDNSLSPSASPRMGASLTPRQSPSHSAAASGDFNWNLDGASGGSLSPANRSPTGGRSRAGSSVNQNVLDVFDNSAWGESIKRSFTMRRSGTRGGRGQAGPSGRAQGTMRSRRESMRESLGRERRPSVPDPPPPPMLGPEGGYIS